MQQETETAELVYYYLVLNHLKYKEKFKVALSLKIALLNTEDGVFHDEVKNQFSELVKKQMSDDISRELGLNPEQAYVALESVDVHEYLNQ
jgi:hypothetical protein